MRTPHGIQAQTEERELERPRLDRRVGVRLRQSPERSVLPVPRKNETSPPPVRVGQCDAGNSASTATQRKAARRGIGPVDLAAQVRQRLSGLGHEGLCLLLGRAERTARGSGIDPQAGDG